MTRLYHFTCDHGATGIRSSGGVIVPHYQPFIGTGVVWLTHDPHASRDALGLSSNTLGCDRMENRFEIVEPDNAVRWIDVRTRYKYGHLLEATRGTLPDLWWLSNVSQRALIEEVTG